MVNELPKYKGYTVDYRLKEFRKLKAYGPHPEFTIVSFNNPKGREMLNEYEDKGGNRNDNGRTKGNH